MHRIEIGISLELSSRWHAGSGEGSLLVDRMLRRDCAGEPYLPGSSLKGIIRESCERIGKTLGFEFPCDPHAVNIRDGAGFAPLTCATHPVDALFGNKFQGADLFVRNARLAAGAGLGSVEITRTSISRARRTALDSRLFSSEYAVSCGFKTRISGFHRHLVREQENFPFAYALLVAGILNLDRVGADKSTGCGMVTTTITTLSYNDRPIKLEAALECIGDADLRDLYEICREEEEAA